MTKPVTGLDSSENQSTPLTSSNNYDLGAGKSAGGSYGKLRELEQYDESQEILKAPASVINRYSLFKYKGMPWNGNELTREQYNLGSGGYSTGSTNDNNLEFHSNSSLQKLTMNPSAAALIEKFGNIGSMGMRYGWSDFLYNRYYGRIPNNFMLTLRRFPYPVTDNIIDNVVTDSKSGKLISGDQPDLARAVTWMSEKTNNNLKDILKFTTKMKYKEIESKIQTIKSNAQGIQGSKFAGVGSTGMSGASAGSSLLTLANGQTTAGARENEANAGYDALSETYPNYQMGPLNIIDKMLIREAGLDFDMDFELKFHYSLRSIGDIDPKLAMLDLMANLLVLTYNTAPFFGGATRYIGNGKFGKPLGDHSKLAGGDVNGFFDSIMTDIGSALGNVFGDGGGGFSLDSVLGGMKGVAGNMLGGILSKGLNTPQQAQAANAFLTGDPTGQWHLTIGNPFNPIAMIGNLCLSDVTWELDTPLSRGDFPTELVVTVKLKPGRPRDSADIESMFNAGRGRLYYAPRGLDDVLNLEGKEPIKMSGYKKNADQSGAPGDAFNEVNKGNAGNNVDWSKFTSADDYIEGKSIDLNFGRGTEDASASETAQLLANNIFHVTEG
jgi:hypothetical protein